ncbi:MAG: hypothetical protein ACXWLH_06755 [Candidatus Saccharimonadales bacterium]
MSKPSSGTTLYCFSPPVMVATMVIEVSLAIYTLWRYKMSQTVRLIVTLLFALAAFQLCEYFVCTGAAGHAVAWSRLGFAAITLLPPLGLHLMFVLADKRDRRVVYVAYGSMVAFVTFFLASATAFVGHQCTGNYVIFQFSSQVTGFYSVYYYGWLLAGIGLGAKWANELIAKGKENLKQLQSVQGLIIGYLVFLVPTALAITFRPQTSHGIPSVMCGFAVLLALILSLYILPRSANVKS